MNKTLAMLIAGIFGTFAGLFLFSETAGAISNRFPSTGVGTLVVEHADAVSVPNAQLKWFIRDTDNSNPTLRLNGFCAASNSQATMRLRRFNSTTLAWDPTADTYSNFTWPGYINLCVGNDLVLGGLANANFRPQLESVGGPNRFPGWEVILVTVHLLDQTNNGGLTKFTPEVSDTAGIDGTYITQAELPESWTANSDPSALNDGSFAIVGNLSNSYGYNTEFNFRPSCRYFTQYGLSDGDGDPNTARGYLRWRDADGNQSYGNQTYWWLVEYDSGGNQTGVVEVGPGGNAVGTDPVGTGSPNVNPRLGDTSNQAVVAPVTFRKNHTYRWYWLNVNHVNVIHIFMPFSELDTDASNCDQPVVDCSYTSGALFTGESITFSRAAGSTASGSISWSGGGSPATGGNTTSFSTTFGSAGQKTIRIDQEGVFGECSVTIAAAPTVQCGDITGTYYPTQTVTFSRTGGTATGDISWSGGETPATGTGSTFGTSFSSSGNKTITIRQYGSGSSGYQASGDCTVTITAWVAPTCSALSFGDTRVGQTFNPSVSVSNTNSSAITVTRTRYVIRNSASAQVGGEYDEGADYNIAANDTDAGAEHTDTTGRSISSPGAYTITWTISSNIAGDITCPRNFNVRYANPAAECTIVAPPAIETGVTIPAGGVYLTVSWADATGDPVSSPASATVDAHGLEMEGVAQTETSSTRPGGPTNIPKDTDWIYYYNGIAISSSGHTDWDGNVTISTPDGLGGAGRVEGSDTCEADTDVGDFPYLREYGGDVWTGGNFDSNVSPDAMTCAVPAAGGSIYAHNNSGTPLNTAPAWSGAGAQMTVTALLNVNGGGFVSANNRRGNAAGTIPSKGLTFANTGLAGTVANDNAYGGGYEEGATRAGKCITDYYNDTRDSTIAGQQVISTPNTAIAGRTVNSPTAIFANGDVYITGNITLGSWTTQANMPSFALIVCGRIFIDNDVTRLDGLYVAQPGVMSGGNCVRTGAPATSGTIYTCATAATTRCSAANLTQAPSVATSAQNPLAINGSVVANRIKWLRSRCSLRHATNNETPSFGDGGVTNSTSCTTDNTSAAETVNYTGLLWLAPSALKLPGATAPSGSRYDFMRTLPPIYGVTNDSVPGGGGGGGGAPGGGGGGGAGGGGGGAGGGGGSPSVPTCQTLYRLYNGQCYRRMPPNTSRNCRNAGYSWVAGPPFGAIACYHVMPPVTSGVGGGGCEDC